MAVEKNKGIKMEREILFRGMDIKGNWYIGLLSNVTYGDDKGWFISNAVGSPLAYEVRKETVGQYIDAKDQDAIRVFVDDVVLDAEDRLWLVVWVKELCSFELAGIGFDVQGDGCEVAGMQVIGNIHDNPEMIEAK